MDLDFCKKVGRFGDPKILVADTSFPRGEQQNVQIIINNLHDQIQQHLEKEIMEYVIDNSTKEYCLSIPKEFLVDFFHSNYKPILSFIMFQHFRNGICDLTREHISYERVNIANRPVLADNVIITYDQIEVYHSDVVFTDTKDNPDTYNETITAHLEYSVRLVGEAKSLFVITEDDPEYNHIRLENRKKTINKILNK